jgi:hypothetical protein
MTKALIQRQLCCYNCIWKLDFFNKMLPTNSFFELFLKFFIYFNTWSPNSAVSKLPSVPLPRFCLSLRISQKLRIFLRKSVRLFRRSTHQLRKIGLLRKIPIKVRSMRLLESGAKSEVWKFDVTPSVQQ